MNKYWLIFIIVTLTPFCLFISLWYITPIQIMALIVYLLMWKEESKTK